MNTLSFKLWKTIFYSVYEVWYDVHFEGAENFPKEGPVIVAPNHLSNNDPPIIGYAVPRHVQFMAKIELFKNPIFGAVIRWLGAFPVNRDVVDKVAIKHALEILRRNEVLGIFPEGTRQLPGKLGAFHDGVASMALRTGTAVVPVAMIGTESMQRGKIACLIGKPMKVEKAKPTESAILEFNAKLRTEIESLINEYNQRTN